MEKKNIQKVNKNFFSSNKLSNEILQAMTLYNDFGRKIIANLDGFLDVFRQNNEAIGHVVFFGLPEHYCNFRKSEVNWLESKYHFKEAKVWVTISFRLE